MSAYSYSDVYLLPRYSELRSRSLADTSVSFLGHKFRAPWLPANMEAVIDIKTSKWLSENEYFYIYHRFHDTFNFVKMANEEKWKTISISVGVKDEDMILLGLIAAKYLRVDFITIDVAHGHHVLVKNMIEYVKGLKFTIAGITESTAEVSGSLWLDKNFKPKIIAGNVATPEAVKDLANWGADAVKVGIAGGAACSTKHQTGFHVPMFDCVKSCSPLYADGYEPADGLCVGPRIIPIIADGGIRENGDIPKALVAGATMVMAGSLFAACTDAPGENVYERIYTGPKSINGVIDIHGPCWEEKLAKKRYHGSASARQKGSSKHVEGFEMEIPWNGLTYQEKYEELTDSLKSAISYAGGKDLEAFKKVNFLNKA